VFIEEQRLPKKREKKTSTSLFLIAFPPNKGCLTQEMVCKFSCQARQYILAYFYIEHKMKEEIEDGLHEINIEKIKKNSKLIVVQYALMRNSSTIAFKNQTTSNN
jgi:hypothetical protein